jgi:predicted dehydrogenase
MDIQTDRRSFLRTAGASALAAGASALQAQSEKPIRIAVIGSGHRAWAHLAILKNMPQYQVVAIADPTPQNLDKGASLAPGAKTYSDYRKMLAERNDIDAVVVITPSFLHAETTIASLNRGLPVLCEKPMSTNVDDANRMIEASKKTGKLLYIGFQKRLVPVTAKMKELVEGGEIGPVQFVSGNLFRGDWNKESWKYTDPKTGVATNWRYLTFTEGSALLEDGIHEVDSLNWIINSRVARVMASGGNNVYKPRETIDNAAIIVEYESGARLSFDFCLFGQNSGPASRRMVIIGSEGVIQPEEGRVSIRKRVGGPAKYVDAKESASGEPPMVAGGSAQDPETRKQYVLFARSLQTGKPPAVTPDDGKTAIKLMLLAEKSLRTHRIMNWNDLPA